MQEIHVLVVDDDPIDLDFFSALIESISNGKKYIVHKARNADEAVAAYVDLPIDCAIIDYNMPGKNGMQLVNLLQKLPSYISVYRPLPVVVISGMESDEIANMVKEAESSRFMTKDSVCSAHALQNIILDMVA